MSDDQLHLVPGDEVMLRTGEVLTVTGIDLPIIEGRESSGEVFFTTEPSIERITKRARSC